MSTNLIKADRQRKLRKIIGYITNSGTVAIAAGAGFSVTRNGVGDVSIALTRPGRVFMGATVLPVNATAATAHMAKLIAAPAASGIRVGTYVADATDGAPADINFCFEITVKDVEN